MSQLDDGHSPKRQSPTVKSAYFTVAEYATALNVSQKSVRRGIDRGEIPHKRVGRLIRIPKSSITGGA